MFLLSRNYVFRVDPSISDKSRLFWTFRASTISDLPINLQLSHKRVPPLVGILHGTQCQETIWDICQKNSPDNLSELGTSTQIVILTFLYDANRLLNSCDTLSYVIRVKALLLTFGKKDQLALINSFESILLALTTLHWMPVVLLLQLHCKNSCCILNRRLSLSLMSLL